jgi:hypothetical protein
MSSSSVLLCNRRVKCSISLPGWTSRNVLYIIRVCQFRYGLPFDVATTWMPAPPVAAVLGPFYTSESRGGVERRQLELKGAEDGD